MKLNVYQKYNLTPFLYFDMSSKLYHFMSFASTSSIFSLLKTNKNKLTQ